MSPPPVIRRTAAGLAAVALLALAGCTPGAADVGVFDVADDKLSQAISPGTLVAGYRINDHTIRVTTGASPETHVIHQADAPDTAAGDPIAEPSAPLTVLGSEFPLEASLERVRALLGECDGLAAADVQALSPTVVVTRATCDADGAETRSVLLGDRPVSAVADPWSDAAVDELWGELEASGLGDRLTRIEVDTVEDQLRVSFAGRDPQRTYRWLRGLSEPDSQVLSQEAAPGPQMSLAKAGADQVKDALTEALADAADRAAAARFEVAPTGDGSSIALTVTAEDWTEIASVTLGAS
ncbi:MAG: hypothetical protein Q4F65_12845 [Propionibacteriaceae bacterium]|nr:hypothetical protein [Propionibacteriaceae bacterium]